MAVWTSYQGVEVVESDPNVKCRHPKYAYDPKRLATLKGASLLLLVDGTFLVVCDECGFNGLTGRDPYVKPDGDYLPIIKQADSLLPHINGMHHPNKSERVYARYTDDQIKVAIKVWLKWKSTAIKNWTQAACDELETRGFKPYSSPRWTPGQLGSLVREYIKKDQFKNLKAGPMDEDDKAALAEMVREAQAREGRTGTHLADNARITTRGGAPKQSYSQHKPVDFAAIMEASEAAKEPQQEVEPVRSDSRDTPTPTLTFADPSVSREAAAVMTLVVEPTAQPVPAQRLDERLLPTPAPAAVAPVVEDFKLVTELDGGTIVFTYKGRLMAGKPVKGVEI